jgi:hypothetical protein
MAFDFPASPTTGQTFSPVSGVTYAWNGQAWALQVVDTATLLSLMWSTGDAKLTLKTVADAGWVLMNDGTIGSASSGSSTRANADCQSLFVFFFNTFTDAIAPILTSAGGATTRAAQTNAATAWANNCRMSLTRQLGRSISIAGAGAGLTPRALGGFIGAETHVIALAEAPPHSHAITVNDHSHNPIVTGGHSHYLAGGSVYYVGTDTNIGLQNVGSYYYLSTGAAPTTDAAGNLGGYTAAAGALGGTTDSKGSGTAMDIMNPNAFWNIMIKL